MENITSFFWIYMSITALLNFTIIYVDYRLRRTTVAYIQFISYSLIGLTLLREYSLTTILAPILNFSIVFFFGILANYLINSLLYYKKTKWDKIVIYDIYHKTVPKNLHLDHVYFDITDLFSNVTIEFINLSFLKKRDSLTYRDYPKEVKNIKKYFRLLLEYKSLQKEIDSILLAMKIDPLTIENHLKEINQLDRSVEAHQFIIKLAKQKRHLIDICENK